MFDDTTLGLRLLANPGMLQYNVLNELSQRMNGTIIVADPNNAFNFMLEAGSSWVAQFSRSSEQVFDAIYAKRAETAEELARHMSDFDYQHATAKPASLQVQLMFDRDYIAKNSKVFNENYLKLVIPGTTVIEVGGRSFGLYYPIEIRTNRLTGAQFVSYDTSSPNPLFALTTNGLDDSVEFGTRSGLEIIAITFPVYQFARARYDRSLTPPENGFRETFKYTDRFYAIRAYTDVGGVWKEIGYTLSDDVYDRATATLKVALQEDVKQVTVSVPQIYFTRGLMGPRLKLELFTTQGELDTVITATEAVNATINFDLKADTTTDYSTILATLPTKQLVVTQNSISGGSNGLSFEELRTRVVNQSLYDRLPISPEERDNYLKDRGFTLTTYLDNLTNRIYFANRRLSGGANGTVPVTVANIQLKTSAIPQVSSIKAFADNTITVLPTTIYRYVEGSNLCVPLTDNELTALSRLTKEQLATELNTTTYTRQPFHIVTYAGKYPLSKTFNLMAPSKDSIVFVKENANASAQMSLLDANVVHVGSGTGGYKIRLGVKKTAELAGLDERLLAVVVMARDKAGRTVHLRAHLLTNTDKLAVYEVVIPTDYHISADQYMRTTMLTADGTEVSCDLPLQTEFDLRFLVDGALFPNVQADYDIISGVPEDYGQMLGLVRQSLTVTFGKDLSSGIYNITTAEWSQDVYATYPEDIHWVYEADEYQRDPNGALTVVDGKPVLVKLHAKGDVVEDAEGNPLVRYAKGSVKRDGQGNPIIAQTRELLYFVEAMQIDARFYASENPVDIGYLGTVAQTISDYVTTVATIADSLIEQTKLYFHPIRSMGQASFGLGNSAVIRANLGLSFAIKYFVPTSVLANQTLLDVIRSTTLTVIKAHVAKPVISMTAIAAELRATLGENITSIDVGSINNASGLQTLMVTEADSSPMVALKMVAKPDGTLALEQDVAITFYSDV